jgi:hypothetical protein
MGGAFSTHDDKKCIQNFNLKNLEHMFPNCVAHPQGALFALWRARVVCMRDIFILDEIWTQYKIYVLVGTLLA